MPARACNGDTSFDAIIKNHEEAEHDCHRGRLFQLQRLVKIGKLNCCSFAEDVPSDPHLPQIHDRRQHKPFNGVCVLPKMPDVDALIQEFETSYMKKSPMVKKKNATTVAKVKGIFVKRIIEMYETKNGKSNPWPLDGRQVNAKATVEDKRRPKEYRSSFFGAVEMSNKAEEARDGVEKRELVDATNTTTSNFITRQADAQVERNGNDDKKDNEPDNVEETKELFTIVPNFHVNTSSSRKQKARTKEKDKGKSSRKLRGFLCKFNRSGSKRVMRRCRVAFPRRDELWHTKRNGRIFLENPLNKDFLSKCDNVVRVSSPYVAEGSSCDADDHGVLTVLESQDDSGNSYKNLQIDMYDFEDEDSWSEARSSESDDDSLSVKSIDQFLPSLGRRNSSGETVEMTYFASSSFEDENNASDEVNDHDENAEVVTGVFADESAKDCLKQSTKLENIEGSNRESKLQQIFSRKKLKKILSLFNAKRCFQKKIKSAAGNAKYSWRLLRKSQQPISSPDSGFSEQSVSMITSSTLPTSLFPSEKSACNDYYESTLTFKTFRPRDSLLCEGVNKNKHRPMLNELSEKISNAQDESSCAILDAQTETSYCDFFPASSSPSSKGSTSVASSPRSRVFPLQFPKHSYMSQKIPKSTFLSLTRVDELSEELDEQLDVSELQPEYSTSLNFLNGCTSSSPYEACKESRWRSAPTLASFAEESSGYFHEPIYCEKPWIPRAHRNATRNVPIFSSLSNITGSSSFATVKPRNWRPYMRPEKSWQFDENDGIRRRSSV